MLEALGDAKGLAWVPDWPGDARMGCIALGPEREHCFTRIQGSRGRPKFRVDLGPYYQSNNCLIQGTFISELLDLRLRKVTVECLTGLPLRSLVAPSKEGPADIYIYIYIYIYKYINIYK